MVTASGRTFLGSALKVRHKDISNLIKNITKKQKHAHDRKEEQYHANK